jgi:putative glycerol-1-phosphate prenyltransferase
MQRTEKILERFSKASSGQKMLAVLIDPDKVDLRKLDHLVSLAVLARVDFFFIGGSLIVNNQLDACLSSIKSACKIPLVLFPGDSYQLSYRADAILFLSLISGRNPELLIGKHVVTAPYLKVSPLEVIPTGYMLIDGGVPTTVSYISNTSPIPSDKEDVAACTAMAGEMLGLKCIFMDAGSGARRAVSTQLITAVRKVIDLPLIIGGGIRTPEQAAEKINAGADIIVVGNAFEEDPSLIVSMAQAVHDASSKRNLAGSPPASPG